MKIALCPGHHKDARGAVNKKYDLNEFEEASKVCSHLAIKLRKMGHSVDVIVGKLSHKVYMINKGGYDLAIDIHFNADYDHLDPDDFDNSRGYGCMVMYCPKALSYGNKEPISTRSQQADAMSFGISSYMGGRDHGGRPGWYWGSNPPEKKDYFLRETNCAAFIPEPGYIDNNGFAEKWLVAERHDQIAEAIALGIEEVEI